jgi:hypothetical protein
VLSAGRDWSRVQHSGCAKSVSDGEVVLLARAIRSFIACPVGVLSVLLQQSVARLGEIPSDQAKKVVPMAQKALVFVVDDLSGQTLAEDSGQTVSFGLDGQAYEIDLSNETAAQLRRAVQRYVEAGRRVSSQYAARDSRRARSTRASGGGRGAGRAQNNAAVREWARANGYQIADRGRIPAKVLEAYAAR